MVLVLKWFIGTLRGQYCSRNEKLGSEKKPLNPFLGELFVGKWAGDAESGETVLASEQVSHHPPITGYSIWNDKHGVYLNGYNGMKARIATTTISVKQNGHATYYLKAFDETYIISLPALHIEGILFGAPYVELEGKSFIHGSSGYSVSIEYTGKGYFSGKKNSFKAKIYKGSEDAALYRVSGQWSESSKIKDEKTGVETPFLDSLKITSESLQVKPEAEQSELESRRAWSKVAAAIREGDYELIHQEKSKIENDQRELRKTEQAEGKTWPSKWFEEVPVSNAPEVYLTLSKAAGVEPETTWTFVRSKFDAADVKP
ncbi:oxysterol-binding protein KES1 [Sugiyamaella lignohabitans]|uniref:Oxysterol-binding protein KES1 n=1 Tax=Sugiyamaella lignohabitans TaxID=796027 RepID=A0A167EYK0_9ASCO|nr:oxysterol-binding protein KES1 [Sugiyamaella lignohabitans]ANB14611.1 oxysterol-binding protein KES1 [Sugiyamaella lignohabitans]